METNTTTERIVIIPWEHLHDSPKQYRKRYPESYIKELAANIKAVGRITSPLLVRPIVPPLFADTGDGNAIAGYEAVSGHCRKRAGPLAGLPGAPCIVREMTDAEAALIMISENLQRKDVHPIEEAEGFADMMKEHGKSADDLAAEFGKSRSYIYGRLKLLQAVPQVRDAALDGNISAEVALLIARLRTDKLQEKALARIKGKYWDLGDGGSKSYRNIRDLLKEEFTLDLKSAIFPIVDESLLASAGACTNCPKRSENAPEYADLLESRKDHWRGTVPGAPNLCTDPDCFAAKKTAHLKREAAALAEKVRDKGMIVIDGSKARAAVGADGDVKGPYVALDKTTRAQVAEAKRKAQLDSKIAPPLLVVIQNPRDGKTVEAVKVADLVAAGVRKADEQTASKADKWAEEQRRNREQQELNKQKASKYTEQNLLILDRVLDAMLAKPRDAADLHLVVQAALNGVDYAVRDTLAKRWNCETYGGLKSKAGQLSVDQLNRLLLECALAEGVCVPWHALGTKPKTLLATAKRFNVSLAPPAAVATTGATPTPSTAAQAQEGGAPAAKAPTAAKRSVKYRDAASGQSWSGRGLMPRWLRVAIDGGAKLQDFEASATPSEAAQAQTGEVAETAGQQSLLADLAGEEGQDQAGSAGRADEGAGDAGASDATCGATEPAEV